MSVARRTRKELLSALEEAGRDKSAATIMFHTAVAAQHGLIPTEEKAIDLLHRFGPLTAGELGERAGLAPASITGLVDRLEAKGFCRRAKDPADGRRVLIALDRARLGQLAASFTDYARELNELYAEFSLAQLETIWRYVTEATRRQRAALTRLTKTAATDDGARPRARARRPAPAR